jgi:hypothetical protein
MAPQQPGRQLASDMHQTNAHSSKSQHYSTTTPQYQSIGNSHYQGSSGLYTTTLNEDFDDSGFFSGGSANNSPSRPREDFQLYDDGPDYFEDDASMLANHGSTYQGNSNQQTSQIPKYTSYSNNQNQNHCHNGAAQGGSMVYQSTESGHPSLFGQYREVNSGDLNPLQRWQVEPHRYETMAMRYPPPPTPSQFRYQDEDIRLTPEPWSPQLGSTRHNSYRSGSSTTHRRHHH